MGILANVGKGIIKSVVIPAGNFISNGIKKGSGTATYENTFQKSNVGKVYTSLLGASTITTALVIPATTKAKAITTAGVIIGGSALTSTKTAEAVTKATVNLPKNLSNVGVNVGKVIEDPSLNSITELVKENPVIVGGGTALALGGASLGIGSLITSYENKQATKENTKAIKEQTLGSIIPQNTGSSTQPINIINQLPATAPVGETSPNGLTSTSTPKKKKKKAKKKAKSKKKSKKKAKKKAKSKKKKYKKKKKHK